MITTNQINNHISTLTRPFNGKSGILTFEEMSDSGVREGSLNFIIKRCRAANLVIATNNSELLEFGILRDMWSFDLISDNDFMDHKVKDSEVDVSKDDSVYLSEYLNYYYGGTVVVAQTAEEVAEQVNKHWEQLVEAKILERRLRESNGIKPRKWVPEHFPPGTIVNCQHPDDDYPVVKGNHVVMAIINNGLDSYLIKSTTLNTCSMSGERDFKCFNITHVDSIVSPGVGNVVFHTRHKAYSVRQGASTSKRKYVTKQRIYNYIHTLTGNNHEHVVYDVDRMVTDLEKQMFTKAVKGAYFTLFDYDKKRSVKWIKANFNKYLRSAKEAARLEDNQSRVMYIRDNDF